MSSNDTLYVRNFKLFGKVWSWSRKEGPELSCDVSPQSVTNMAT